MQPRRRARPVVVLRPRRHAARLLLCLAGTVLLLLGGAGQAAAAHYSAQTSNGTNNLRADVLAPPTSLSVSQQCVTDPTPAQRGTSSTAASASGTVTVAHPSAAVAGDVLVAVLVVHLASRATPSITAPAEWTMVRQDRNAELTQAVYRRVVPSGTSPTSATWSTSGDRSLGAITAYSGVDTASPVNVHSGAVGKTAPSVTTTRGNAVLIGAFSVVGTGFMSAGASLPASMSTLWTANSTAANGDGATAAAGHESWPTPGATGSRTASPSGSVALGQLVALQPPSRPQATTTWTVSASPYATGQLYRRSSGATVQSSATLSASATSRTSGPLVSGTGYTIDVAATFANWSSTATAASFTALTC